MLQELSLFSDYIVLYRLLFYRVDLSFISFHCIIFFTTINWSWVFLDCQKIWWVKLCQLVNQSLRGPMLIQALLLGSLWPFQLSDQWKNRTRTRNPSSVGSSLGQFLNFFFKGAEKNTWCPEIFVLTTFSLLVLTCHAEQDYSGDVELETLAYSTAETTVVIDQPLRLTWRAPGHLFSQKCINWLWHYCPFDYKLLIWASVTESERCPKIPGFTFPLPEALWRGFPSFGFSSLTGLCFTRKSLSCCAGFVFLSDVVCHPACLAMLFRHWHHILIDCLQCFVFRQAGARDSAGPGTTEQRSSCWQTICRTNVSHTLDWIKHPQNFQRLTTGLIFHQVL